MYLNVNMKLAFLLFFLKFDFCLASGVCIEKFEIKSENLNKRLVPYTFIEKIVRNHHNCIRECFNFGGECKAVNYNMKNQTCEFNYKGSGDVVDASDFEQTPGYMFIDITDWPRTFFGGCAHHDCQENQRCSPLGNVAYKCIDKVDCDLPPSVENGLVSSPVTTEGAHATYSCNYGYEIAGPARLSICTDGTWTGEAIACTLKDCGPPPELLNGVVDVPATTHGGSATYTCNFGYYLITGDLIMSCVDGTWNGVQPSCAIKDCGSPPDLINGAVNAPQTTHGSVATYTCNVGHFIATGDSEILCVDGTWNGEQPSCASLDCGSPPGLMNGVVNAPSTASGDSATFTCDFGYSMSSGDSVRTCVDGSWSGEQPYCTIKDCGSLPEIQYATLQLPATTHGAEATYSCIPDHGKESGNLVRTCNDGTWSGTQPKCAPYQITGCYVEGDSEAYTASQRMTETGLDCQRWDSQSPHSHTFTVDSMFPFGTLSDHLNQCRDPSGYRGEPWCYTTDPSTEWGYCGVPNC